MIKDMKENKFLKITKKSHFTFFDNYKSSYGSGDHDPEV